MTSQYYAPHRPPPLPLNSPVLPAPDPLPSPQTPRARKNRPVRSQTGPAARPNRQTFLDDVTPVDAARGQGDGEEKDPHDLAFSPRYETRSSVVDNMLLSLDQISNPGGDPYLQGPRYTSPFLRPRGNTFSSEHSSEFDFRAEESYPRHYEPGHEGLGGYRHMPGAYEEDDYYPTSPELGPNTASRPTSGHRKSRKSGKSSASSSVDLGPNNPQLGAAGNRRSQSFDYGYNRPRFPLYESEAEPTSPVNADEFDAAPTPIIHAGPSRGHSPVRRPPAPLSPIWDPTSMGHGGNVKQAKQMPRKGRAGTVGATPRTRSQFAEMENIENLPPMPLYPPPPPKSPVRTPDDLPLQKEKSGFFRRVFGSRHAGLVSLPVESDSRPSREVVSNDDPPQAQTPAKASKVKESIKTPKAKETPVKDHPTLQKKSSSFFRRRKKSVSDVPAPPPSSFQPLPASEPQPSPVSSLRQVMDPYLSQAVPSPKFEARTESSQGYHTARTSMVQGVDDARRGSNATVHTRKGSKGNAQLKPVSQEADTTFFDSSGAEELSNKSRQTTPGGATKSATRNEPVQVRFPFTSTSSSRGSTPVSGSRTPHSPTSPTVPDFTALATSRLSKLKLLQEPLEIPKVPNSEMNSGARMSPLRSASDHSVYKSAPSTPLVSPDPDAVMVLSPTINITASPEPVSARDFGQGREQARKIFENRDELGPGEAAAWLGDAGREHARIAFMNLFDWTNMSILSALRGLCARIALRAETQQVDRLLDAFAKRWCDCNRTHGFKSCDVVHTVCYSTLLLNTDLHLADIGQKMTRNQFIRNTLPTLRRVALDSTDDVSRSDSGRAGTWPKLDRPLADLPQSMPKSPIGESGRGSIDDIAPIGSARSTDKAIREGDGDVNDPGPLVTSAFGGSAKAWEVQVEIVLKRIYSSIARERLPLFGAKTEEGPSGLLSITGNMLRRTPSTISKATSEHSNRRAADARLGAGRWAPKSRSRPQLYPVSTHGSTRTSMDEASSAWSPSMSSTWSKASQNKTLTSMSVDSFATDGMRADYQKSIGFANALSQAIIREDSSNVPPDEGMKAAPLLDDESLELSGAPWAKEGNVKHKHHLEGADKRAKDRNWNDCFAVIAKGWMRLFSFSVNAKSLRSRQRDRVKAGAALGGGNWTDNAEEVCKFLLRQTIASALPEPGYSKARPHVWALSLPTGAVHLFQVGTTDIVKEFVSTANYWSARLSKEPMTGGTSNMEYGWSDNVINRAILAPSFPPTSSNGIAFPNPSARRPSMQSIPSSLRSSIDAVASGSTRPKLPGDKAVLHSWTPPQQSMMASQLMEVDQLRTLQTYIANVEDDLSRHNELRPAVQLAFSPRGVNQGRAMANWERKSSYLLKEIVKFKTYVDVLVLAQREREKVMGEREKDTGMENEMEGKGKGKEMAEASGQN